MSQISEGSALVLALAWAIWIYELAKVMKGQRNRLIDLPVGPREKSNAAAISPNLEPLISRILRCDGDMAVADFLGERLAAYESIVAAYRSGDRETLHKLVSPEVYDAFCDAIEARQEATRTVFSRIDWPEILAGLIDDNRMGVSIRFAAEYFELPCDCSGQSVVTKPKKHHSVDIWTFARVLSSPEGEWRLIATEAGAR
ncbi:MAG: Tim44 domain-containing protein [Bradyrhizobium sp.]|nr:39S ribosomal protein L45 [Pseudomonadota bacterium]MDE2066864.1 Tim44 domain-containing protein [Bradyrhizobium sp.]MDE2471267.1 Tim44 domain-containing protein [Bradyrhizobium sp.]